MKRRRFLYIDLRQAIEVHDYIVDSEGGLAGVCHNGQLDSLLTHIQNDQYYPTVYDKVTHLVYGIITFHVFNDGNKRTALALGAFFFGMNYSKELADKFIIEMENVVVDIAEGIIDKALLKKIIMAIFLEDERNEILFYEIYKALKKHQND